tara:strand:- start:2602 stop:4263 length:1662 start_codon:yes stop_codon:yes gene_type:complete
MSENFSQLFEESIKQQQFKTGAVVTATIIEIANDHVIVNAGLKSEGVIAIDQFKEEDGSLNINVGDEFDVAIEALEDGFGETILSRERAKRFESWTRLSKAHDNRETIIGNITSKVKGGFTVEVDGIRAFLPGSLVDVRPLRDTTHLENRPIELKLIKLDQRRNNVVVSRRAVIEEENNSERSSILENMKEGTEIKGVVKNLTDYGAFVDLGGVDGLLHITDMSWKRIKHPSEILNIGDEIDVKVLKYDAEKRRVSLGMKQLGDDPWQDLIRRFPVGARLFGKVTTITDYGCFVEIENGVEGLIHMSEMDWTNKNVNPNKLVAIGDEVEVMVLEIDEDRRRVSLGLKQCKANPWQSFSGVHAKGEKVSGPIKSITDFGIFIGLDGEIDGLVHLSDISWTKSGEEAVRDFQKGQELEAVILAIDPEKERISLGIKQLDEDALSKFRKNEIVTGTITAVDAKQVTVDLGSDVVGTIRANDLSDERVEDATTIANVGDSIEAKIIGVDRKTHLVTLSVRAKDMQDQKEVLRELGNAEVSNTTLGDLLKEQIDAKDD